MKHWRLLIFLAVIACTFSCKVSHNSDPLVFVGKSQYFGPINNSCNIIPYYIRPSQLASFTLEDAADSSFVIFASGFPRLMFQPVTLRSKAHIVIEMVISEIPLQDDYEEDNDSTLSNNKYNAVTAIKRLLDGSYVIQVKGDFAWTKKQMTRAIAYQIGMALGLRSSDLSTDIMYPYIYRNEDQLQELSENDISNLAEIYDTPCSQANRWLVRRSELKESYNPQNKYSIPVTFSLPNNDTLYLLWPNPAKDDYLFKKIVFDKDNPQKDTWKEGKNLSIAVNRFEEIRNPAGVFAFTTNNRAFIGSGQRFTNTPEFYEYQPKTGSFIKMNTSLPMNESVLSIGIGTLNRGYVLSINELNPTRSFIGVFNTGSTNRWEATISPPEPLYTASTIFATPDNRICIYNGYAAYFLNINNQWSKISYNTNDLNVFKEPRNLIEGANELSLKAFSIGTSTFLLRDNFGVKRNILGAGVDAEVLQEELWLFSSDFSRFQNKASLDAQGLIQCAIGHKGKGYVFTSLGRIYEYTP